MRICFLDQTGQLGGAELMLLDLAAGARVHHEVEVILFDDGPFRAALEAQGVVCRVERLGTEAASRSKESSWKSLGRELPDVWSLASRLARRIREFDADVVYSNTAKALLVGAVAARWAGRPLVHHLHDILDGAHFSRANRWLLAGAANWGARGVIANSKATAAAFVASGGRRTLLKVIPNGFDAARFQRPPEDGLERLRGEWPWHATGRGGCVFGVFGRLTPWKGQMVFLEALALVPEAQGVIVGGALFTDEDRAYEEALRRRAEGADLRGRVCFTGFRADVVDLMYAVDVVVHCSTQAEPFGRVIVEAQLCGVPVIAARGGGAEEIVSDGETGLLSEPGAPGTLADRMLWMIKEDKKRLQMGLQGLDSARSRYGLAQVLAETSEFLGGILNKDCG
jgi:glycosyltransferase involved in cell wall biosynthesis